MSHDIKGISSDDFFLKGKKLYIVGDYSRAIEMLIQSCKMKEMEKGHFSNEILETYIYLAKSYYMYSKFNNDLIEGARNKSISESDVEDALVDDVKVVDCSTVDIDAPKDDEKVEIVNVEIETKKLETVNEEELQEESSESKEEKTGNEDLSYLQLSYEMMESAKLILRKQLVEATDETLVALKLKMADCHDVVGNIYMEESVLDEAIAEYRRSLDLRLEHSIGEMDRAVAESYYNLGMAYSVDNQCALALDSLEKCRAIMVACKNSGNDSELDEIIADLDEKISDCQDGQRDYALIKDSLKQLLTVTPLNQTSGDLTANDITNLVRRKQRRSSDSTGEPAAKVAKKSEEENQL